MGATRRKHKGGSIKEGASKKEHKGKSIKEGALRKKLLREGGSINEGASRRRRGYQGAGIVYVLPSFNI